MRKKTWNTLAAGALVAVMSSQDAKEDSPQQRQRPQQRRKPISRQRKQARQILKPRGEAKAQETSTAQI